MTAQEQNAKIIDRIRNLLKVANNDATGNGVEHERDIAMKRALTLLAKHNLSMADVAVEDKEDRDSAELEEFPCPFRRVVGNAIAEMYFCKFFFIKIPNKQKYMFHFVGLESNCNTAKEMTAYLIKSICQESTIKQREAQAASAWGTTFRNAASRRISERCAEFRAEAEAESAVEAQSTGTALVLANLYETEKVANENYIVKVLNITDLKPKTVKLMNKSQSAAAQGRKFGDNVSLSNQITGNAQPAAPVAGLIK